MTQHAHNAARYSAVVALAGALLAPNVTAATAVQGETPTPNPTPAAHADNTDAENQAAVNVPGEANARMPQAKVEQPAAKATDSATVTGSTVVKNGQGLEISGSRWGANTVIAVKYDGGEVKPTSPVTYDGQDLASRGVVAVVEADANGNFKTTLPFPTEANWAVGSEHEVTFLSGKLRQGDEQHSATHKVTVSEDAPAAEAPKAEDTPKAEAPEQLQVNETPAPAESPRVEDAPKTDETPAQQPAVNETPKVEETPAQPKADDNAAQNNNDAAKNETEQPNAEENPAPQTAENAPAPAAFVNSQTVNNRGVTVTGVKYAKNGQEIEVSGTGWKNADGTGSVIAVKYDGGEVKPTSPVTYDGQDFAGRGVVAVVTANSDGTFTAKLPFPNAENSTGFEKWTEGSKHEINFLSGSLQKGDGVAKHSATLDVTVGDAPVTETPKDSGQQPVNPPADETKKPEPQQPADSPAQEAPQPGHQNQPGAADNQDGTANQGAQDNAPAPAVETQTVADGNATVTGPKTVNHGQGIVVKGSGWSPYSVIAVKYDSGDIKLDRAVAYNGKDYASRGVVAIIQADANGNFTYTLPFPNSEKWSVGTTHEITFLSGSLKDGDEQHSVTLEVKIADANGNILVSTPTPVGNHTPNNGAGYGTGNYNAGSDANGSGFESAAPVPTQSGGSSIVTRQAQAISNKAALASAAEQTGDTLINRLQARAKAAAKNGSSSGTHAKSAGKKTQTAKAAPSKNGTQGNATTAATQADGNDAPNIIGAELTGFSRWFANNANNVLLSIAGLIILVLALTFRKRA